METVIYMSTDEYVIKATRHIVRNNRTICGLELKPGIKVFGDWPVKDCEKCLLGKDEP